MRSPIIVGTLQVVPPQEYIPGSVPSLLQQIIRAMRKIILILSTVLALPLIACAQESKGYGIEALMQATQFREVAISPDGHQVAFITTKDDFEKNEVDVAIWRLSLADEKPEPIRLTHTSGNYRSLRWSPEGKYLAFLSTRAPAKASQLFLLDTRGGEPEMFTDGSAFKYGIDAFDWMPSGDALWVAARVTPEDSIRKARDAFYGDVRRYIREPDDSQTKISLIPLAGTDDIETRAIIPFRVRELRVSPDGAWLGMIFSPFNTNYPFYDSFLPDVAVLSTAGDKPLQRVSQDQVWDSNLRWGPDSESLYLTGMGEADSSRAIWTNTRINVLDIKNARIHHLTRGMSGAFRLQHVLPDGSLIALALESTRSTLYRIMPDGRSERIFRFKNSVRRLAITDRHSPVVFSMNSELYLAPNIDALNAAQPITQFNANLDFEPKITLEIIRWVNSDEDTIEGVLYGPPNLEGERNLPLVVDIHGGPWEFAGEWGLLPLPAYLASRGYLVLRPNYRGGIGRGDDFLHAIEGFSCSRPADDILTGIEFLVSQGRADPERMGVRGYSYGGVLVNCLIGRTDKFKAALSGAGIWNPISSFGTRDGWAGTDVLYRGKAPWEDLKSFWEESAISRAASIKTPTLFYVGEDDRRMPTSQSFEAFRALSRQGVPTELLVFPGEGHGFSKPKHKLMAVQAQIDWLSHYLLNQPRMISRE